MSSSKTWKSRAELPSRLMEKRCSFNSLNMNVFLPFFDSAYRISISTNLFLHWTSTNNGVCNGRWTFISKSWSASLKSLFIRILIFVVDSLNFLIIYRLGHTLQLYCQWLCIISLIRPDFQFSSSCLLLVQLINRSLILRQNFILSSLLFGIHIVSSLLFVCFLVLASSYSWLVHWTFGNIELVGTWLEVRWVLLVRHDRFS